MSELIPTELKRLESGSVRIVWSDGTVHEIPLRTLRKACPCARCKADALKPPEKKAGLLPVLSPSQASPLSIERMAPVGNYAYSIEFSDGHHSGIYSFEFLREIGDAMAAQKM